MRRLQSAVLDPLGVQTKLLNPLGVQSIWRNRAFNRPVPSE